MRSDTSSSYWICGTATMFRTCHLKNYAIYHHLSCVVTFSQKDATTCFLAHFPFVLWLFVISMDSGITILDHPHSQF